MENINKIKKNEDLEKFDEQMKNVLKDLKEGNIIEL